MELINGRTTDEVRRYDLFKLIVAVALMINWLFFWAGPLPESWGSPPAAPGTGSLFPTYTSYSRPAVSAAPSVSGTVMPPPSRPARLAVSWRDGRVVLEGVVRDEAARQQLLEAAGRVAGQADRVDDRLRIEAGAPGYDWLPNLGSVLTGFGGPTPAGIDLDGQQVALSGEVADEAEREGRMKAAETLFGPGVTVVDRLTLRGGAVSR